MCEGRKLGGVLVELAGDLSGECSVVVGIGLNVSMPASAGDQIDQAWVDLASMAKKVGLQNIPERNVVGAFLLNALVPLLAGYEQVGFSKYRERWESLNAHAGMKMELSSGSVSNVGVVLGVAENGALKMEIAGVDQVFVGGELSLRPLS